LTRRPKINFRDIAPADFVRDAVLCPEHTRLLDSQLKDLGRALISEPPAGTPYIFVAGMGNGHAKAFSLYKRQFDKKLPPMEPWVLHDLRRTARSLMSRLVRPDIAERVLGHTIGGVEGVYNRYDYDAEKTDALAKLAAAVERIINPPEGDNVVPLRASS
jgi:integrase